MGACVHTRRVPSVTMVIDFKKECRQLYLPKGEPCIVDVPAMRFIAVHGHGDPNRRDGAYQQALAMLYAIAYTVKMSKKGQWQPEGYTDFVVPPLEGFWRQDGADAAHGIDYARKDDLEWTSAIRMPDFVNEAALDWGKEECMRRKGLDCAAVELMDYDEGLCVQCMHVGPYDDEPKTLAHMHEYMASHGYMPDVDARRPHHEIYLSDPRRVAADKLRTVIRQPVCKA